ncbi:unnamed protein product [Ectocarpus sp. CCAP 1310/34]|nr:unnamed protein product [Ectocarpus sp. CCAP 1310/34]
MASKKGTGPSKEHMAQGLALRDGARDGSPGRGATQGFPVVQPAGGRGKDSSSNSKSRYSAAAAANNRSRGEDCRFRLESKTSDGEGSSLSLATATGEDEEEEEELSDEPDAWDEDRKATLLASGKAGQGTRSGKGRGKRTRSIPPLSSTTGGSAGLQNRLSSVIDLVCQKMTAPAVPTVGGGKQGGSSSRTESDEIKDLLKRSIQRQEQVNQQIFTAMGMMHGGVQPHPLGMQAGAGTLPPFGGCAGFGRSAASAGLALPAAVGVPPRAQPSQGATASGARSLPVVAGGGQAARVSDASSAGGGKRRPSFGASYGGRATGATSAVAAGSAARVRAPRKATPTKSGQTLCECGLPASHSEVKSVSLLHTYFGVFVYICKE